MKQYTPQDGQMPDVMAPTNIIEPTRTPALWDLRGVDESTDEVDSDALHDRGVEVIRPFGAATDVELDDGCEAGRAEGDVEGDAGPVHVGAVEGRVPRQDDAADAEGGGADNVCPAADGFAVEGGVFCGHDGSGDEEGDTGVVDAGEAFHQVLLGDAVHCVP